ALLHELDPVLRARAGHGEAQLAGGVDQPVRPRLRLRRMGWPGGRGRHPEGQGGHADDPGTGSLSPSHLALLARSDGPRPNMAVRTAIPIGRSRLSGSRSPVRTHADRTNGTKAGQGCRQAAPPGPEARPVRRGTAVEPFILRGRSRPGRPGSGGDREPAVPRGERWENPATNRDRYSSG